jgi:hypothetical protein
MIYALIILAIGLLLVTAAPRGGRCDHEFVPSDSMAFVGRRQTTYQCEKCGLVLGGQI